jgi:hypothetical protein
VDKLSGIFGKLREKKGEWDKKREEGKVEQIQKQMDKALEDFKKDLGKQLGKMGLSLAYAGLSGADAQARKGGALIARFNDIEGYTTTLVQAQHVYEGTPHGAMAEMRKVYWSAAIWSTIVNGSTPFSLLFKEVGKGFMKGSAKVFIPFISLPFNEKDLLNSPLLQTPVVAALNSDKDICDNIANLGLGCQVNLTYKAWLTVSCPDMAGKCVIVPAGDETVVSLRTYGTYGEPKLMFQTLAKIRKHISAHQHTEMVNGKIPAPWINTMYALCKAKSTEGTEASGPL